MYKQDPSIRIKRLDQESCNDLPVLYYAVYGRKIDAAYFVKKYSAVSKALEYTGYLAYRDEHTPVAFIGAVCCELLHNSSTIPAAQLTDGMTDPCWRGKGLFVQLVEKITALCMQHGLRFLFGFPNQQSLPVFLGKLNWQVYGKMNYFNIPVRALPFEKLSTKIPLFKIAYRICVKRVLGKYRIHSGADEFLISILDAKILARIHHGLAIGEMQVSEKQFAEVMHTLQGIAKRLGLTKVFFHCSTGSELHRLFAGNYAATPSFTVICKDPGSGVPFDTIKFSYADIDIFRPVQ